jgi:DNA-binding transcriptional ArsR family regulator
VSVEALRWAFIQPVKSTPRFVLVVLADHADQAHSCYPSVSRISERTGLGASTVRKALHSLQEAGLIQIQERVRGNGSQTSSRYVLAAPNPDIDPLSDLEGGVSDRDGGGLGSRGPESPKNPQGKDPHAEAFGAWWEIYPRRISKQAAIKAWKARTKDKTLPPIEDLLEITTRYAATVAGKEQEFIPHPATWLNQHRWEDVPTSAPSAQDGGPSQAYLEWLETPQGKAHLARKEAQA